MPIIKLNGEYSSDLGWVHAVMAYPDDKQLRDQFFAVYIENIKLREAKMQQILPGSTETRRLILEAPGSTEFNRMDREKTKKAIVAGNILASMYLMDKFSITEPSMNKAIFVVQKFAASATYGDGSEIAKSERMVREACSQFHSVAHLWAAVELNKAYQYAQKNETTESKRLIDVIENRVENVSVLLDKIINGKVNHMLIPFRMLLFEINK